MMSSSDIESITPEHRRLLAKAVQAMPARRRPHQATAQMVLTEQVRWAKRDVIDGLAVKVTNSSVTQLAQELSLTPRTVSYALAAIEESGLFLTIRRGGRGQGSLRLMLLETDAAKSAAKSAADVRTDAAKARTDAAKARTDADAPQTPPFPPSPPNPYRARARINVNAWEDDQIYTDDQGRVWVKGAPRGR
jgi:DNA-binding transcriptional ArsR family regulator